MLNKSKASFNAFKIKAFTMAEILIVLGIIGVVAEMTLPSMVAEYQKQVYVEDAKKVYSSLSDALNRYMQAQGCSTFKCTGAFDTYESATILNGIAPYLRVQKNCGRTQGCFYNSTSYFLNKTPWGQNYYNAQALGNGYPSKMQLESGAYVVVRTIRDCTGNNGSPPMDVLCAYIVVDVNGDKKPNTAGRDIFLMWMTKNSLVPYGTEAGIDAIRWDRDNTYVACRNTNDPGQGCLARIVQEGWQMNY